VRCVSTALSICPLALPHSELRALTVSVLQLDLAALIRASDNMSQPDATVLACMAGLAVRVLFNNVVSRVYVCVRVFVCVFVCVCVRVRAGKLWYVVICVLATTYGTNVA
jgi:hypothetical protein